MLPTEEGHNVFELFDAELAHEWEMYPQPHLNKLVTYLILLNLKVNITVFEIKNRSPNTIRRSIEENQTIQNPVN